MIQEFQGKYRFLSNFYECPVSVRGITYPSAEHAYQAQKASVESGMAEVIRIAPTPGQAKKIGHNIVLPPDWEERKVDVMRMVVEAKFMGAEPRNLDLRYRLIETGDEELVEGNFWHDAFWGTCNCQKCQAKGPGKNILGKLLMETRIKARIMTPSQEVSHG